MEPIGIALLAVVLGGTLVVLERTRAQALERARTRAQAPLPQPTPLPEPPGPGPAPSPTPPGPAPTPPQEELFEIPSNAWKDLCWWDESGADVYLDSGRAYVITWPVAWAGDEPVHVYVDPSDLAQIESEAYWVGDDLFVDIVVRPSRSGWGTLMITEGESGAQAVHGETPWRAQCVKIEVR